MLEYLTLTPKVIAVAGRRGALHRQSSNVGAIETESKPFGCFQPSAFASIYFGSAASRT